MKPLSIVYALLRRRWTRVTLIWLVYVALGTWAWRAISYRDSGSALSLRHFFDDYWHSPDRMEFLQGYHDYLAEVDGGVSCGIVNDFLLDRLSASRGKPEWDQITWFLLLQGSDRGAWVLQRGPDALKGEVIASILSRPDLTKDNLLFLESLKRPSSLSKGGFRRFPPQEGETPFTGDDMARMILCYRTWWGDGSRWPANKEEDPLEGEPFVVRSGP